MPAAAGDRVNSLPDYVRGALAKARLAIDQARAKKDQPPKERKRAE